MAYISYNDAKNDILTQLGTIFDNEDPAYKDYEKLIDKFADLTEQYNDDNSGRLSNSGYFVSAGDMKNSLFEDFVATGLKLYYSLLVTNTEPAEFGAGDTTTLNDRVQLSYSDKGVHFMMVSFAPLYKVTLDANGGLDLDTVLDLKGNTNKETVTEDVLSKKKTTAFENWKNADEDVIEEYSETNSKNYKDLLKEISK